MSGGRGWLGRCSYAGVKGGGKSSMGSLGGRSGGCTPQWLEFSFGGQYVEHGQELLVICIPVRFESIIE